MSQVCPGPDVQLRNVIVSTDSAPSADASRYVSPSIILARQLFLNGMHSLVPKAASELSLLCRASLNNLQILSLVERPEVFEAWTYLIEVESVHCKNQVKSNRVLDFVERVLRFGTQLQPSFSR